MFVYLSSCSKCKGLLRPHVIWFGEPLDTAVLDAVDSVLAECDLCLLVSVLCRVLTIMCVSSIACYSNVCIECIVL